MGGSPGGELSAATFVAAAPGSGPAGGGSGACNGPTGGMHAAPGTCSAGGPGEGAPGVGVIPLAPGVGSVPPGGVPGAGFVPQPAPALPAFPAGASAGEAALFDALKHMNSNMATNTSMISMYSRITIETKEAIAVAVDPLKDEMQDLRERLQQLETSSGTGSVGKRHLALLSAMDVSNRRVAFV
eukprot:7574941-Pyramimonas_sp.AAC.1